MSPAIGRFFHLAAVSTVAFLALPKMVEAEDAYLQQSQCQSAGVYTVQAKIQVSGTLKPSADTKTATLPITVDGSFAYDEMRLDDAKTADRRSLRYYHEAAATI